MVTRNECHRGKKHMMVNQGRAMRLGMIKSATRYPDCPRAKKTTPSRMHAAAPAKKAANSNIRAANRRPANNKSPVPRTANAYIS